MSQEIKNEIKLLKRAEGFYVLTRNGFELLCPHVPPIPMMSKPQTGILGAGAQPQIVNTRSGCTSMCPLFQIEGKDVSVCCGTAPVMYKDFEIVDESIIPDKVKKPEGTGGKIISMGGDGTVN